VVACHCLSLASELINPRGFGPNFKEITMQLDESDLDYMRAEDFHRRRYQANLASHHDCRDPDHPGCELCEEENDDE